LKIKSTTPVADASLFVPIDFPVPAAREFAGNVLNYFGIPLRIIVIAVSIAEIACFSTGIREYWRGDRFYNDCVRHHAVHVWRKVSDTVTKAPNCRQFAGLRRAMCGLFR
jgi:hypothetical protein